jgi:hypothetical protein
MGFRTPDSRFGCPGGRATTEGNSPVHRVNQKRAALEESRGGPINYSDADWGDSVPPLVLLRYRTSHLKVDRAGRTGDPGEDRRRPDHRTGDPGGRNRRPARSTIQTHGADFSSRPASLGLKWPTMAPWRKPRVVGSGTQWVRSRIYGNQQSQRNSTLRPAGFSRSQRS